MELAQDKELINKNTTYLASKQEQEQEHVLSSKQEREHLDPTSLPKNRNNPGSSSSSCSSLSSLSSMEDDFKPEKSDRDQLSDIELSSRASQWPETQVMERSPENAVSPNPNNLTYKLPSHVFARTTSTAPGEWSTFSNESLFSIHMGNMSITGDYFKSGELSFPQPPLSPSPFENNDRGGAAAPDVVVSHDSDVAKTTTTLDTSKKLSDSGDKGLDDVSSPTEQKVAPGIREVIQANEAANNSNNVRKMDRSMSRHSDDFSVKSFAFPILGNVDKSGSLHTGNFGKQRKPSQPETPKIAVEAQTDEEQKQKQEEAAEKSQTPKAGTEKPACPNNRWLSLFPCCSMPCI